MCKFILILLLSVLSLTLVPTISIGQQSALTFFKEYLHGEERLKTSVTEINQKLASIDMEFIESKVSNPSRNKHNAAFSWWPHELPYTFIWMEDNAYQVEISAHHFAFELSRKRYFDFKEILKNIGYYYVNTKEEDGFRYEEFSYQPMSHGYSAPVKFIVHIQIVDRDYKVWFFYLRN